MSSKLRPVEEVAGGSAWMEHRQRVEMLQADREATVKACAEAFATYIRDIIGGKPSQRAIDAILAVAKPPESTRERLARVMWERRPYRGYSWADATQELRDSWMEDIDAVQAELAKIRKEEVE